MVKALLKTSGVCKEKKYGKKRTGTKKGGIVAKIETFFGLWDANKDWRPHLGDHFSNTNLLLECNISQNHEDEKQRINNCN